MYYGGWNSDWKDEEADVNDAPKHPAQTLMREWLAEDGSLLKASPSASYSPVGILDRCKAIAPTRASTFPETALARKEHPVATGVLDYFPDALVAIAHLSWKGNEQHHPGTPVHWDRAKSADEADALIRHFLQRGTLDKDGIRHSAKMAWRALALLQKEIEGGQ